MDDFYGSPMNLAHHMARKADANEAGWKYDEAILCHQKAAEYLETAISMNTSSAALESISLQHSNHLRRVELIKDRKAKMEALNQSYTDTEKKTGQLKPSAEAEKQKKLPINFECIYKTMNDCNSLLHLLDGRSRDEKPKSAENVQNSADPRLVQSAIKMAKDEHTIIEELRILNESLQKHVSSLLNECDELRQEKQHDQRVLEGYRIENSKLREELSQLRPAADDKERWTVGDWCRHIDIALSPLEIPKFDLDLSENSVIRN